MIAISLPETKNIDHHLNEHERFQTENCSNFLVTGKCFEKLQLLLIEICICFSNITRQLGEINNVPTYM